MEAEEEKLVTLLRVSQELVATLDLQRVLQTATDRVTELTELKSAAVYLLDGEALRLWATTPPLPPQFPEELRDAPLDDHPHIRRAITTGKPVFIYDTALIFLTPAEQAATRLRGLRSILYLPLQTGTKVLGTLIVGTVAAPRMLSNAQIDLCLTLANMAAIAVENARLYESSQRHADELEKIIAVCKQTEEAQHETLQRLHKIASQVPGVVYQFRMRPDGSASLPYASDGLREVFDVSPEEVREDAARVFARIPPEDYERVMATIQASAQDFSQWRCEFRVVHDDGTVRWLFGNAMPQREADGSMLWHGFATDITERKQAEDALRRSETRLRTLYDSTSDAVLLMDENGFFDCNLAALKMSGCATREEFCANTPADLAPPRQPCGRDSMILVNRYIATAMEKGSCQFEWVNKRFDNDRTFPAEVLFNKMTLDGRPVLQATIRDITERKQAEACIQQMAHYDTLTGLPNRILLNDRVNRAISMAQRSQNHLAVLFVDLDHFKNINDTLGHRTGDELLIEIARRLKSVVREEDTVSRLGGDEFILLLPETDADGAAHVADKLLETVSRHYLIEQHELLVTPSIGMAIYPGDGEDFETLSMHADAAMYRAKRDGRNNYRFFTAEMQARTARNLQLGNALRRALERNQLHLHYQPQISLESGRIIGAEALLRWQHPGLDMISPAEFIPVAEESGMILLIGEWVLRSAVRQLKAWMDGGIAPMVMAVNLSVVQFRHANLPELVSKILKEEGVSPQYLELELTEGVAMEDPLSGISVMGKLHEYGIRMAIDDFGTGYSSLGQLKRFQIYKLKIDQSFVRDITEDPEDKAIVAAIISMANSLGMQTIAEGVETAGQLEFLREKGCNEVQGYYFSKPLPADQFESLVRGKAGFFDLLT